MLQQMNIVATLFNVHWRSSRVTCPRDVYNFPVQSTSFEELKDIIVWSGAFLLDCDAGRGAISTAQRA
jgi:hypothetical protein